MTLVTLDTATLIKSALDPQEYRTLIKSTAVTELQSGGLYMLKQLANSFLPRSSYRSYGNESQWREWYYYVVKKLSLEGIKTPEDIEQGADQYVALRREWNDSVMAFAKHMAFSWHEIAPVESDVYTANFQFPINSR